MKYEKSMKLPLITAQKSLTQTAKRGPTPYMLWSTVSGSMAQKKYAPFHIPFPYRNPGQTWGDTRLSGTGPGLLADVFMARHHRWGAEHNDTPETALRLKNAWCKPYSSFTPPYSTKLTLLVSDRNEWSIAENWSLGVMTEPIRYPGALTIF